jgi:hypothetical protein
VIGRRACGSLKILGAALEAYGETCNERTAHVRIKKIAAEGRFFTVTTDDGKEHDLAESISARQHGSPGQARW